MWAIFLSLYWICYSIAPVLCVCVCVFGQKACGISAPQPGIKSTYPALEDEVLTFGPPGKSLFYYCLKKMFYYFMFISQVNVLF